MLKMRSTRNMADIACIENSSQIYNKLIILLEQLIKNLH